MGYRSEHGEQAESAYLGCVYDRGPESIGDCIW